MKRIAIIASAAFALCASMAQAYEPVWFDVAVTTAKTYTVSVPRVTGKVVYAAVANGSQVTGMTNAFSIATVASTGASILTTRTIVASTNVTTATVESTPNVYLNNETVKMTVVNSGTNTASATAKGVLILETYDR